MRTHVPTIVKTATMRQAIAAFAREGTNGLIVIDEENPSKVAGILSSRDVISLVVPDYLESERELGAFAAVDMFYERVAKIADEPVVKHMTEKVHVVNPEDTLMMVATYLSEHGIRQLPVVDNENNLVGYISRTDIRRALNDAIEEKTS